MHALKSCGGMISRDAYCLITLSLCFDKTSDMHTRLLSLPNPI